MEITKNRDPCLICQNSKGLNLPQAEKLNTYRFCDNVWTFMLKEVQADLVHMCP